MPAISRIGDVNSAGGAIINGSSTVFANGIGVGLQSSVITPHPPYGLPHPPHRAATTTNGSTTVFADGKPVLKVGSGVTCGHNIVQGSPNIFVQ